MKPPVDIAATLATLARHGVEFVVIGGVAASLHGCPLPTYDLDILYRRSEENLDRLLAALGELDAVFAADLTYRRLVPTRAHLEAPGPKLLQTRFGRLDILGEIRPGVGFDEIFRDAEHTALGSVTAPVISLDRLIEIKEWMVSLRLSDRGARDQMHLIHLKAIRARRS